METTLFLAKVFGLYLLVMGLLMPLRRKELSAMIEALADNRPLVFLVGVLVLILGLVLVVSHNVWIAGWPLVITVLAWLVLIKALAYLVLPFEVTARLVLWFNRPAWFTIGGALWAALGLFLVGKGFQVF
jgi:hypothetical protein